MYIWSQRTQSVVESHSSVELRFVRSLARIACMVLVALAWGCEEEKEATGENCGVVNREEPCQCADQAMGVKICQFNGLFTACDCGDRDMSMVLITHDLGVVRGRADEVMVLYGGRTMEQADTATLFDRMRHPYTEALLETIPRIDTPSHTRLVPIPGRPPTHTELRGTCPFAPRCRSCTDACLREAPPLIEHGQGHFSACFAPVGTTEGAAARADNQAAGTTPTGLSMVPFGSSKES